MPSTPSAATEPGGPVRLDLAALSSLAEFGFTGGRDSFLRFCDRVFRSSEPRFLRTQKNDLVVFRNADLRALGAMPQVANVPPELLYPGVIDEAAVEAVVDGKAFAGVIANQVFTANEPIHAPVRKILLNQFGPRQVVQLESLARHTVRSILDELPQEGEIDVVADVAEKLTARFWGVLLGMTAGEAAEIAVCVRDMTPLFFIDKPAKSDRRPDAAAAGYRRLIEGATERSLAEGGHPMLEAMAAELAAIDLRDDLSGAGVVPKTVGALMAGNLIDGFHTAALAAANTVHALLRRPDALAAVKASPELTAAAVLEALRLESPLIFVKRYLTGDVVYDGLLLPAGAFVVMLWAGGNHDPAAFPDPERFDLSRSHRTTTTFGIGASICPGRHLAVMLVRVLLEALAANEVDLEPVDGPETWIGGHMMSQLRTLPVQVRRRPAN